MLNGDVDQMQTSAPPHTPHPGSMAGVTQVCFTANDKSLSVTCEQLQLGFFVLCGFLFCFFERERICVQRETDRENLKILSRFHTQRGPRYRAWSHDPDIMTWAKIKKVDAWLSHPDAPELLKFERFNQNMPMGHDGLKISGERYDKKGRVQFHTASVYNI